ncbi:tRNA lysidine(34) synthetase TilS [Cereibacter sp. SYSU M97828]|nr:tRNA lysidine(34) synthetase TilS [Cereibacter flavus]
MAATEAEFLKGLGPVPPVLGLAVSGGGDSMALLSLASALRCHAVTVDHGLRAESRAEAEAVARHCAAIGIPHDILRWQWDGTGNLQDAARRGRYALIAEWAQARGIGVVALGHTQDDVAETFLMRLARGAGLDGLSAMRGAWFDRIDWRRPLLGISRAALRDHLTAKGIAWIEDPSNDDPRFERVRARQAMAHLPLGLTAERLAEVAGHLSDARAALDAAMLAAARSHARIEGGDVVIDPDLPPEILRRLVLHAMAWVAPSDYGPRGEALLRALTAKTATLHGCVLTRGKTLRIAREAAATPAPAGEVWDCWRIDGLAPGQQVSALGEDIALCPRWRESGLPRRSLLASPAVREGGRLVAAPLAGFGPGLVAQHIPPPEAFHSSPLSH